MNSDMTISRNLTTLRVTDEEEAQLRKALQFYNIATPASFFRSCMISLIRHAERKDPLFLDLKFQTKKDV